MMDDMNLLDLPEDILKKIGDYVQIQDYDSFDYSCFSKIDLIKSIEIYFREKKLVVKNIKQMNKDEVIGVIKKHNIPLNAIAKQDVEQFTGRTAKGTFKIIIDVSQNIVSFYNPIVDNTENLSVGDKIGDLKIKKILKRSVCFEKPENLELDGKKWGGSITAKPLLQHYIYYNL